MLACVFIFCLRVYGKRFIDGIGDFTVTSQKIMLHYRFIDLKWSVQLAGAVLFPFVWFAVRLLSAGSKLSYKFLLALAPGVVVLVLAVARGDRGPVVAVLALCALAGVMVLDAFVLHLPRLERAFLVFYVLQLHYFLSRADSMHLRFLPFAAVLLLPFLWPEWEPAKEFRNARFAPWIERLVSLL